MMTATLEMIPNRSPAVESYEVAFRGAERLLRHRVRNEPMAKILFLLALGTLESSEICRVQR